MENVIDFVLTWVDDSDIQWQINKKKYDTGNSVENKASHYRDWGTLKYWFRAVEKYAPWVNAIYFITCGQTPDWLNVDNPKLKLVFHEDYMPTDYLPTFSANPIELNFHRIEDLSEQFVYFNDDTFLTAPVQEEDFFKDGLPCDSLGASALIPSVKGEVITHILFNDVLLINANFNKRECLKRNLGKWLNFKYGRNCLKNLYYMPISKFSGFENPHLPNSFLKSTFETVWQMEGKYLDSVSRHRFRNIEDVNQYLMRYWQLVEGKFFPRKRNIGVCYEIGTDDGLIEKHLLAKDYKMMCINDQTNMYNFSQEKMWICSLMENLFPEKSGYEKA